MSNRLYASNKFPHNYGTVVLLDCPKSQTYHTNTPGTSQAPVLGIRILT